VVSLCQAVGLAGSLTVRVSPKGGDVSVRRPVYQLGFHWRILW